MKNYILIFSLVTIFSVFLMNCSSTAGVTDRAAISDAADHKKSPDWQGVYTGNSPGVDGNIVQVVILLSKNFTYTMETKTIGESDPLKQQRGRVIWDRSRNTVQLDQFPERYGSPFFELREDHIVQYNPGGNRNEGAEGSTAVFLRRETNPLLERTWQLTNLTGSWVGVNDRVTIVFSVIDQRFLVRGLCNAISGEYVFSDDSVLLRCRYLPRMHCDKANLESALARVLPSTDDIMVHGNYLMLISNNQTIATFELLE